MSKNRKKYTPAEQLGLTTQVNGVCPICGKPLFYKKNKKSFKAFEIAHIYPLNPKNEELEELRGVHKLNEDPNDTDNLIPLCRGCHGKFDKPRTVAEYHKLMDLKLSLLRRDYQQEIQVQYPIEDEIKKVIDGIYEFDLDTKDIELSFDPKRLNKKFDNSITKPTRQKIQHNVSDYFSYIKNVFVQIEKENPSKTELMSTQIKAFYLKQKEKEITQQETFQNISEWLFRKTKPDTIEAAEIVVSYFVQSCEVFE